MRTILMLIMLVTSTAMALEPAYCEKVPSECKEHHGEGYTEKNQVLVLTGPSPDSVSARIGLGYFRRINHELSFGGLILGDFKGGPILPLLGFEGHF